MGDRRTDSTRRSGDIRQTPICWASGKFVIIANARLSIGATALALHTTPKRKHRSRRTHSRAASAHPHGSPPQPTSTGSSSPAHWLGAEEKVKEMAAAGTHRGVQLVLLAGPPDPLHCLTDKYQPLVWTEEYAEAFPRLRTALTEAPVLVYPDVHRPFIVDTDTSNLLERLRVAHDFSCQSQDTAGLRQKCAYDQHCKGQAFKPGDRVWIHCPVGKKGLSPKLQSHWRGPGEVVGRLSEMTYRVRMPNRGRLVVLHQDRLAPYHPLATKDAAGGKEGSSPVPSTPPAAEEATQHTTGRPTWLPSYLRNYEVNRLGTAGSSGISDPLGGGCVAILPLLL
ncbi:hypothetical protein AAFF_G00149030 [Aldrovandia affinis]|uniref:Uncharacterized protein n=1 Tax=Aldrovandia affinis TaxID=143900 RepID=A0AAD7W8Y8_9TELE|nr:hypothetical protein AAFF_G00149030 [Aldrovandia affinis]